MLFQSEVITQGSGSIGGVTYSHNRSGLYRRARRVPVNPNSAFQVQIRAALTGQVTAWTETLTDTQRATWNLYGNNVPVLNPLGASITLSGQNWFIACNTPRLQALAKLGALQGPSQVNTAPFIFDRGTWTDMTFVADVSTGLIITFSEADAWAGEVGAAAFIYMSRPQNASINFYNGPWRLVGQIIGGDTPAPVSPVTIAPAAILANGYPFVTGQKVWLAIAVSRTDGRLSTRRIFGPEIAIA